MILFKNGMVIDGSGKKGFMGHVLVKGEKIQKIIKNTDECPQSDQIIDIKGQIIAPGFIDMHSHSDWIMPHQDHQIYVKTLIEQGVTTLVNGNCGFSPAPISPMRKHLMADSLFSTAIFGRALTYSWQTMGEFLNELSSIKPVINAAQLQGHATLRFNIAQTLRGPMPKSELNDCIGVLEKSLDEGACGMSFGLGYDPGMYSPLKEIESFCRIVAKKDKIVCVHLKALSKLSPAYSPFYPFPHNLRALKEMLKIAKKTKVKLQLSHLIFVGKKSRATAPKALKMVEDARKNSIDVKIDAFPYTCGNTTVNALLPYWFLAAIPRSFDNKKMLTRLFFELEAGFRLVGFNYKDFQVMDAGIQGCDDIDGLFLPQIAKHWGVSPFKALLRLCKESGGNTLMLFHNYSGDENDESIMENVLKKPYCLFETDALIKDKGYPNPAAMGAFPKILGQMVRDRGFFSIEDAISRMTYKSAQRYNLKGRGLLAMNNFADLVIFDPKDINDSPNAGRNPYGRPKGISSVYMNGQKIVHHGKLVENVRSGQIIYC